MLGPIGYYLLVMLSSLFIVIGYDFISITVQKETASWAELNVKRMMYYPLQYIWRELFCSI